MAKKGKKGGTPLGKMGSVNKRNTGVGSEKNAASRDCVAGHNEASGVLSKITQSGDGTDGHKGFGVSMHG